MQEPLGLNDAARFHQVAFEHGSEGVIVQGVEGQILLCNPAAERILGLSAAEMAGLTSHDPRWETVDAEGRALPGQRHPAMLALRDGVVRTGAMGVRHVDGTMRWLRVSATPVGDGMDRVVVTTFVDVTAEVEATRSLARSERRARLLAEESSDMISTHTPEGVYTYASSAATAITGYAPEQLVGTSAYDHFHPEDLAAVQRSHDTITGSVDTATVEYRLRRADGSYAWVETTSRTISDGAEMVEIVAVTRDLSARHEQARRLHHRATTDPLTGLANRSHLLDVLSGLLARGRTVGVGFIDLDGFKEVNDTHGHDLGDEVLRIVATRLRGVVREEDVLGRYGGDEFVVLCPDMPASSLGPVVERLRAAVEEPIVAGGHGIGIGASVGVAEGSIDSDPEEVLRAADHAMYDVKRAGRHSSLSAHS